MVVQNPLLAALALNVPTDFAATLTCLAKILRTLLACAVLDYWQFDRLHSLYSADAELSFIPSFSLGRVSLTLYSCQNPLFAALALNVPTDFAATLTCLAKILRTLLACAVLDYWQFDRLHSLYSADAELSFIPSFSLRRVSLTLYSCQNPQ